MTMRRRDILRGSGAGLAALGLTQPSTAQDKCASAAAQPAAFILVHGTWHGGWVWQDVANRLRAMCHHVYTPTCTGCGERLHLSGPNVGLATHITDIAQVLKFEDLEHVILVGHSFSGITITGVADRCRERINRFVFFDALVPREGRMSGVPRDPETGDFPDWWKAREQHFIDGYQMDLWQDYPMEMLVPNTYPEEAAKLKRLITPHPAKQWTDELVLERGGWEGLNPTYIHCVGQTYRQSSDLMVGPARGPDWNFIELNVPRDGMLTHPELVSNTLTGLID